MQFGIGILGKNWDRAEHRKQVMECRLPARPQMKQYAVRYAAKIAADSVMNEPATEPDLSDHGIMEHLAMCANPPRPSEVSLIREAYINNYGMEETI